MLVQDSTAQLARAHYGELARIGKALASPVRLQLLDLLRQGPRSVEVLADAAGVSLANASQHLQEMRSARLVAAERQGQHVQYRLAGDGVSLLFGAIRELAEAILPELDRLRRELRALAPAERDELLSLVRRGEVTLLDVRPEEEYRAGYLPGARCIPLDELRSRLEELPRNREVVAYCRGPYCPMALCAVRILEAAGYRARHLDLGVPDLRARGFRVLHRAAPRSHARAARPGGARARASSPRMARNDR